MSYNTRVTLGDVWAAYHRFREEARLSGLLDETSTFANRGLSLHEGRPRWGENWEIVFYHCDDENNVHITHASKNELCPDWVPRNLTSSRGTAYRTLNEATDKLRTKRTIGETSRRAALDEAATLLLDAVGVETYRTMITDGLTPVEALRTAVLLGRME